MNTPRMGNGHLSADTLADLAEDLLDEESARAGRDHLRSCPRCSADLESLWRLPALLSSAAGAAPMPEDVIARVDEALAAEATRPVVGAPARASVDVTPLRTASGPRGMRFLQAAAVVVLLLAGVGLGVTAIRGGGDNADSGTMSAESGGGGEAAGAEPLAGYPVTASGRDWDQKSLVDAVPGLVTGSIGPSVQLRSAPSEESGAGDDRVDRDQLLDSPAGVLAQRPALADCLSRADISPETPVAVDIASWEGQPAAVIVLPADGDPSRVDVYVVEPSCPEGSFLFYASQPRP